MAIVTKLSVAEIQQSIVNSYSNTDYRNNIFIPNVSFGLLPYEADLLIMNKSGYVTEIEIKRSWEDFMVDFKKDHKHDAPQIYKFAFCIPEVLIDKAKQWYSEYIQNGGEPFAVMSFSEDGKIEYYSDFGWMDNFRAKKRRKLFIEEQLKLARLGCLRLWKRKIK